MWNSWQTWSGWLVAIAVSLGATGVGAVATDVVPLPPGRRPDTVRPPAAFDEENRIAILFAEETQRFGISCLRLKDPADPKKPKLLTRSDRGLTNNTVVHVDGKEYLFGTAAPGIAWAKIDGKVQKGIKSADGRRWTSVMDFENERIRVSQTVQILVGEDTHLYDSALVRYEIENHDAREHTVGLRFLLDTCVGANNGTPFFLPPTEDAQQAQIIDTKLELTRDKIPPFLRMLESTKFDDPMATLATLVLRLRGFESPDRLVLCRWPHDQGGAEARWEWKYQAIDEPKDKDKDSCMVLYWARAKMKGKEKRLCGFTYGLGRP